MIGTRRITRRSFLAAAGLAAVGASLSLTGCSGSVSDGLSSKHLLVAHSHSEAHPVNVGLQKMTEVASAESHLTFSVYPNCKGLCFQHGAVQQRIRHLLDAVCV